MHADRRKAGQRSLRGQNIGDAPRRPHERRQRGGAAADEELHGKILAVAVRGHHVAHGARQRLAVRLQVARVHDGALGEDDGVAAREEERLELAEVRAVARGGAHVAREPPHKVVGVLLPHLRGGVGCVRCGGPATGRSLWGFERSALYDALPGLCMRFQGALVGRLWHAPNGQSAASKRAESAHPQRALERCARRRDVIVDAQHRVRREVYSSAVPRQPPGSCTALVNRV